jgi:phospholipase/carboxylesterase
MKQGNPISASLQHLVFYPEQKLSINPTIVALHGRGADAYDLVPLVEALGLSNILLIAPRAPLRFEFGGYAWYGPSEEQIPERPTFQSSLDLLRRFLEEVRTEYPTDPKRLILLGFSQGTVMAYAAGLLEPAKIRGIAALSGYIPLKSGLPLKLNDLSGLSVFISHGAFDELIPAKHGLEAAELLRSYGANVWYREYQMGHQVSQETMEDLTTWIRRLLGQTQ